MDHADVKHDVAKLPEQKSHTSEPFEPLVSDPDASHAEIFEFELSELEPQIVAPPERVKVSPVSEFAGTKIDRGFIGSCANSRLEDMRIAARILKGRKVHRGVELNITPGSASIYRECLREGIIEVFVDADVCVPVPCCGMCNGYNTPLGSGEVCLSTAPHNLPERAGSDKAEVYLGSPATVAASAVAGEIIDPRNFL